MASATCERIREADEYLLARTGRYEWRCARYDEALEAMYAAGLDDRCTVVDVGSGWGEFGHRMVTGRDGWTTEQAKRLTKIALGPKYGIRASDVPIGIPPSRARYVPVDAALDGMDLDEWIPPRRAEFFVCLEVIEHLRDPWRLVREMQEVCTRAIVVSTPNPETTDVLGMDATHVTPVTRGALEVRGFKVRPASFYGQAADSLFGVWTP